MILLWILFTLPSPVMSQVTTTSTATDVKGPTGGFCLNPEQGTELDTIRRKEKLDDALNPGIEGYQKPLDIAFILDRSKSIGMRHFEQSKQFVSEFLDRYVKLQYMFIHKAYTRVSVLSFGSEVTVEFNGFSGSDAIDSCLVKRAVENIQVDTFANQSQIAQALSRARELFATSRADQERPAPKQVVWLFYDGECILVECKTYTFKEQSLQDWGATLRNDQITVFTVGVGQWLDRISKVLRIQNLASSVAHYACAKTWLDLTSNLTNQDSSTSVPQFSEITSLYKQHFCESCPEETECACNVISQNYTCTDEELVPLTFPTSTTTQKTTNPPQPPDPAVITPSTPWLLPVAIGSSVGGGVFLILLLVIVPIVACRRQREFRRLQRQVKYVGPLEHPSNIRIEEAIYGDIGNHTNAYDQTLQTREQYENVPDNHKNMEGWPGVLAQMINDHRLLHLVVHSSVSDHWAHTAGLKLRHKELKVLDLIFLGRKKSDKVKFNKMKYTVDHLEENILRGRRLDKKDGRGVVLWVYKVYDYLVLGVSWEEDESKCGKLVCDLYNHFLDTFKHDQEHLEGSDDREYVEMTPPEDLYYSFETPFRN